MPALRLFCTNWKIGSDDFVFPFIFSICGKVIWLIVTVSLIAYNVANDDVPCANEKLLKIYLAVQIILECTSIVLQLITTVISGLGTIAHPAPRRHIYLFLYIQALLFLICLAWDFVGIAWAFDSNCSSTHSLLIFSRLVIIWNLVFSITTAVYMIVRIGLFRLICLRKPKLLRYENKRPSVDVKGRRLSRLDSFLKNEHKRQRKWQWILQSLFCSYGAQNQKTSVFNAVSATLADGFHKFRGYVPTDILAGFALMKLKQITEKYKGDLDPDSVSRRKVNFSEKGLNNHLLRMIRYLKFCIGSYGWLFHIYSKGMYGLLQLIFLCGYRKKPSALNDDTEEFNNSNMIIGDNLCKWSTSVILRWTGIYHADLIYANFKNTVYCPVCYIAVDHREKSVVVIVRGTLSFADALTDLSAQPAYLMSDENGVKFYVHQGMLDSAQALHMKLEGDGLLQKIFNKYPSFKLVLAGHSLGAGVASILALILKPVYPKLHCYAYAPPGGLMNKAAAQYTKSFITAVFFENDIVPRLSIQNFEQLGNDMLKEIETCKLPKFRIFLNSFLEWTGCYKPHYHDFHHEKNDFETKQLEKVDGANSEEELVDSTDEEQYLTDPITGKKTLPPFDKNRIFLYMPGRVMHITKKTTEYKCCGCTKKTPVLAEWVTPEDYSQIIIHDDMVADHMPDVLLKELQKIARQEDI